MNPHSTSLAQDGLGSSGRWSGLEARSSQKKDVMVIELISARTATQCESECLSPAARAAFGEGEGGALMVPRSPGGWP